ncbi:transposase-like protein [Roseovarius sp. MBR-51]
MWGRFVITLPNDAMAQLFGTAPDNDQPEPSPSNQFPPQTNAHVVRLYARFNLGLREVAPGREYWSHKGLENRAENSHLPFRKRQRVMQGLRLPLGVQRFAIIQSTIRHYFAVPACRRPALTIRYHRLDALEAWTSAANVV